MSILSGIGQIPPVFGTGGGGTTAVTYQIPSNIDVLASGGTTAFIVQNLPVPNGNYLVIFCIELEAGDNNTLILSGRLASTSGGGIIQITPIYNTQLLQNNPCILTAQGVLQVSGGVASIEYEIDQTGNSSTLTLNAFDGASNTGVVYFLPINPYTP
jgi:hypothetical protein